MRVTCRASSRSVPEDLHQALIEAGHNARGGAAVMLRRLALLGLAQADPDGANVQVRTAGMPPATRDGLTIVVRLPDDSPLSAALRDWSRGKLLDAGTAVLLLASWGWARTLADADSAGHNTLRAGSEDTLATAAAEGRAKHQAPAAKQIPPVAQQKPASAQRSEDTRETTRPAGSMEGLTPAQVVEQMTPAQLAIANDLLSQFDFAVTPADLEPAP